MWVGQTPMFQVGPDGAVNVDQPMMIPPGTQPMYWSDPNMGACQSCPGGCVPPTYAPTTYATPTQWVAPQPCAPAPIAVQPPPPAPIRWTIFGEALWIHPTGVDMAHAQVPERIHDRIDNGRRSSDGRGLSNALRPERMMR